MVDGGMGQAPEPGRRRRRRWWPALAGVLALGLLVAVCAGPVGRGIRAWTVGRGSPASAQPAPSPRPGDPPQVAQRWLADQITARLVAQSAALLGGDQDGFLAPARAAAVRTALKSRYAALRALRVAVWRPELVGLPVRTGGDNRWRTPVRFHHCFVTPDCRATSVVIDLEWAEAATGPEIVTFGASPATGQGPRPWEDGELVAAAGKRTLVATIPAQRDRLPQLLAWAEAAAVVADRYVVTGTPPERYVVFLAGRAQWKRWYGGGLPPWTSGYAVPLPQGLFEVVLNPDQLTGGTMPEVLRHELAHVSSLPDGGYDDAGNWWLAEGLADVAGADGRSVSGYPGLPDVQRQFKAGWDGRFEVTEPDAKTPDWQVSARYGIAYLAVRHLNDRFGQRDLLTFFRRVVHERRSPDSVSLEVFGQPWERVRADCAAYVRAAAD